MGGPPPGSARPRLVRSERDRVVAGVAGGLGAYLGVDATLLRVAFVVLTVFGGVGVLLYLVGWVSLPAQDGRGSPLETGLRQLREAPLWLQVLLIVLVGLVLAGGIRVSGPLVVLAVVLIALGYALFRQDTRSTAAPPPGGGPPLAGGDVPPGAAPPGLPPPPGGLPPPPPGGYPPAGAGFQAPGPGGPWTAAAATATRPAGADPGAPPPPAPPRPRSVLGRATVGVAVVAVGVTALLDATGVVEASFREDLAVALVVLGLGLVVGAWRGRARWLIAVGLLLLPVLVVANLLRVPVSGALGERAYAPRTVAEVQDRYQVGIGRLELDLSGVRLDGTAEAVRCRVGIGKLEVVVPPGAAVEVRGQLRGGTVDLFDRTRDVGDGLEPAEHFATSEPGSPASGRLRLVVEANYGEIIVRRG